MFSDSYSTEDAPEVPFDYGMRVKDGLFLKLYTPQIEYWNKRLETLSKRNVAAYAREDVDFFMEDDVFVSIFFNGDNFNLLPLDEDDDAVSPYSLELYEHDDSLMDEFPTVAGEIERLQTERYEAQRFLASLMLFDPPPLELRKVLGDGLFFMCQNVIREAGWVWEEMQWEVKEPKNFEAFVASNGPIIEAMQQRQLLNMITI